METEIQQSTPQPTPIASKAPKRIEWIDAMRGFTMIMVVAFHVAQTGFGENLRTSSSLPFLVLFRMPLFFFISGFLAYKASAVWSFDNFLRMTGKKIRIQIIPTIVFFFVAMILLHPGSVGKYIELNLHSPNKGGYWFTLVLLYMFIVYYIFTFIEHRFRRQSLWPILLLWIISIAVYETIYMPHTFWYAFGNKAPKHGFIFDSSIFYLMMYFQFFIYGNIVHRYWDKFEKLCDRNGFCLLVIILAFVSSIDFLKLHWLQSEWVNLSRTVAMYSLLTLVFIFFRYYRDSFSSTHRLGRMLQYIGKRTLDIYLIHIFMLPNLPQIGKFFNANRHNFVMDTTASILVAMIVIAFCLVISNMLRISPFLKKYLFGRETNVAQHNS